MGRRELRSWKRFDRSAPTVVNKGRYFVEEPDNMHRRPSITRFLLMAAWCCYGIIPAFAQGTEKAIEAAVLFASVVGLAVVVSLGVSIAYLFQRRKWQRWVVVLFGAVLLIGSALLSANGASRSMDMTFIMHVLCGAGLLFTLLGALVKARPRE